MKRKKMMNIKRKLKRSKRGKEKEIRKERESAV